MEICYLLTKNLRRNPNNPFSPLSDKEYVDLRESIFKYGVIEPLIVFEEANGFFTVVCGNNRLRAAEELGIKILPCIIIEKTMLEGAFDTEIFRRHLAPDEKERLKKAKKEIGEKIMDDLLKEKLLPELYNKYKNKIMNTSTAILVSKLDKEFQIEMLNFVLKDGVLEAEEADDRDGGGQPEGRVDYKAMLDQKEARIERLRKERQELKDKVEENEEKIAKLEKELNKAKSGAEEVVKKEFETKIEEMNKVNESLRAQLRKKDEEIERMKEEGRRKESKDLAEKVERKAGVILELEERRKYMVNLVILRVDEAVKKVEEVRKLLAENALSIKDATIARDKIKSLVENSRELLSLINIAKTERMEKSVMDLRSD